MLTGTAHRGCLATDDSIVSTPKSIGFSSTQRDILYLQIAECALKIDISFTQEIRNSRSVNLVRMTLGYNVHQIFQKIKY